MCRCSTAFRVIGFLDPELKARADSNRRALLKKLAANRSLGAAATAAANPPLLTVQVAGNPKPMSFPTQAQWPPTPPFLADVQQSEISNHRSVLFGMTGVADVQQSEISNHRSVLFGMTGVAGIQQNAFYINGKQFDPSCVDETMTLGQAEQWAVQNGSAPAHPFHIHTNPFQIERPGPSGAMDLVGHLRPAGGLDDAPGRERRPDLQQPAGPAGVPRRLHRGEGQLERPVEDHRAQPDVGLRLPLVEIDN